MTREEWLRHAVEYLNSDVFKGDLDILNHDYQIACGRCPGKKHVEVIQPSDGENISLDDFFPTTIHVDFTIKDPIKMLEALAFICVPAFFNIPTKGKQFKTLMTKYEFIYTDTWEASDFLKDGLRNVYKKMVKEYGEFPGKPIKFQEKIKGQKKKTSFAVFCPECGYEMKISKKMLDKHNNGLPTCPCGMKMGIDFEEDEEK